MGVRTTADEHRQKVRDSLVEAERAIAEFVLEVCINECWGADEYRDDFKAEMRTAMLRIHELREMVG